MSKRQPQTIDRLYVLNAGLAVQRDRSVYTPGKWQFQPITLSCNAYLIRRAGEWILFDTGIEDAIAGEPGGRIIAHNIRGIVVRTIRDQLAEIGLRPIDIGTVILSHGHFDHIGNANMFAHAAWLIQRREHQAMFGPNYEDYGYSPPLYDKLMQGAMELMDGDHDVFGDGSVRVISTPGHTPGHCSLLVQLKKTGPVLLSGDVAHYRYNMEHRCVPTFNSDPEQSVQSIDKIANVVRQERAQLWINHDAEQSATIANAPEHFE
jgi:glyoxylase-like metal-dependent hydrolase (beta-lactamase superfamily II)